MSRARIRAVCFHCKWCRQQQSAEDLQLRCAHCPKIANPSAKAQQAEQACQNKYTRRMNNKCSPVQVEVPDPRKAAESTPLDHTMCKLLAMNILVRWSVIVTHAASRCCSRAPEPPNTYETWSDSLHVLPQFFVQCPYKVTIEPT